MKEESKSGNTAVIIACTGIIILPLLYVLSIGPISVACYTLSVPPDIVKLLELFYAPVLWLHESTPLGDPLDKYIEWWLR